MFQVEQNIYQTKKVSFRLSVSCGIIIYKPNYIVLLLCYWHKADSSGYTDENKTLCSSSHK